MSSEHLTQHARIRMAQRGIRDDDLDLIKRIGSEVEGGYFVRDQDAQDEERRLKREIDRVRRIRGKRVVVSGDRVVTVYHAGRGKERRLLRRR